jgi:5S rRNA maturation endonuclease (ribonuclease M5)
VRLKGFDVPVDVEAELREFDWEQAKWTGEKLIACSPFRDESRPSFYVWLVDTDQAWAGSWGDSGGSGEFEKGGLISLLSFLRNESPEETVDYLVAKYGTYINGHIVLNRLNVNLEENARKSLPLSLVEGLQEHPYLTKRGISKGVQRALKTGYDAEKKAIAFPWFLPNGKLAAVKYRRTSSKRFFYAKGGYPIRNLLYGVHILHQKDYLDTVVVTEAEIDAMTAMTAGFPAVAVGGSQFNPKHTSALMQTKVKNVIIASDNDEAGVKLAKQIEDALSFHFNLYRVEFPDGAKDLNELGIEKCNKALNGAKKLNKMFFVT